jgi:hypothetical protein
LAVKSIHIHRFDGGFDKIVCLKIQMDRCVSRNGLVQLGLMWRHSEPGFDIGFDRHVNLRHEVS